MELSNLLIIPVQSLCRHKVLAQAMLKSKMKVLGCFTASYHCGPPIAEMPLNTVDHRELTELMGLVEKYAQEANEFQVQRRLTRATLCMH